MSAKKKASDDGPKQFDRFKQMAREVGADESPDALDRAFLKLDPKKKDAPMTAKRKTKRS